MTEVRVEKHGFVRLVDTMPREDLDHAIVQAARVSYGEGTKSVRSDRGLIRYLLRHAHTTPFEMVDFKFHIKMPIFLARQHMRHRTASINEISGRYSQLPEEFHIANGAITLFRDDNLSLPLHPFPIFIVRLVVLFTMDEHHHVSVLLDGS